MIITKITIQNFKCFNEKFSLSLNSDLNILVGDNEVGKSTILESIQLALSGMISGRYLRHEIDQSLFNKDIVDKYLEEINAGKEAHLPFILIELHIDFQDKVLNAQFNGDYNSSTTKKTGLKIKVSFDSEKYKDAYNSLLQEIKNGKEKMHSLPVEYYDIEWSSFARKPIVSRLIPLKSSLIDSSSIRHKNGSDIYISKIIKDGLNSEQEVQLAQAHRKLKGLFSKDPNIQAINKGLSNDNTSEGTISLEVDLSSRTSWDTSLTTNIDGIPFTQVGKGEQAMVKTKLALKHKKSQTSNVILIEEPENHLSHSKLNRLVNHIKNQEEKKQIIITSHSSFVSNKINLCKLILLNKDKYGIRRETRLNTLLKETREYFERLSGYDTLRMILCERAILVEGDSDELIVQRAYLDTYKKLPIEDGVEVITVRGLAFKRYLQLAEKLEKNVYVVTDNDANYEHKILDKYQDFKNVSYITICADGDNTLPSLEEQLVKANASKLQIFWKVIRKNKTHPIPDSQEKIVTYMKRDKVGTALKIFDSDTSIIYPVYIQTAIKHE
jgi:putative ATP-dependent endonuclease of OLD family